METTKANEMVNNEQLQQSFDSVEEAVQGEREDELFYDYLISQAPTSEEKEIISSIRDDERRHNVLFRRMYEDFTGEKISEASEEEAFQEPMSYLDGIKRALFGELSAVERYRSIRRSLPPGPIYRDILFDIITDELKHASKYNYLFTLNSGNNSGTTNGTNNNQVNNGDVGTNPSTTTNNNMDTNTEANSTGNLNMNGTMGSTTTGTVRENTADFKPDDWVKYIAPLVNRALAEAKEGINPEHLYQEFILAGVLIGLGKKPQEAIQQVEDWENTGESKLLAMSKMSRYFDSL